MTRSKSLLAVALFFAFAAFLHGARGQGKLQVGDEAPEFPQPLPSSAGEEAGDVKLSLKDVVGKKNIVLAFYVADWTGG